MNPLALNDNGSTKEVSEVFERTVLSNGLRVLSSTMPHTRSASMGIFVGAGSRYEDDARAGASHFLEHMLFKGTERRPAPELVSGVIESVGGVLNAATDREATVYWAKVGRDHFRLAIDLLADMVLHSTMEPAEVERERGVIIEELAMTNDQPDARAELLMDETLWPNQPMGRDIGGSKETVSSLTRDQLRDYHRAQYVPGNTVVSITGNVTHEEVVAEVQALMGDWTGGPAMDWYPVKRPCTQVDVAVEWRKTDQAHLCFAMDGVSSTHGSRYAVDLMNTVLGEGMTSRLFMEVRERQGLAYEVHSSADHFRDCGCLTVYCGVEPSKVDAAVSAIVGELEKMHARVGEEELRRAMEFSTGRLMLRLEDTRAVMSWLGAQELLYDRVRTPDEVIADVRKVTAEQIIAAAEACLTPGSIKLAVVGPYRSAARFRRLLAAQ